MTAPDRTGDGEPRFAGSVPARGPQHEAPSRPHSPASAYAPASPDAPACPWPADAAMAPAVTYGPGFPAPEPSGSAAARRWGSPAIAAVGGVMTVAATFVTWASLRLASAGTDSQSFSDPPNISYDGFSLLEGRVLLVFGVAALAASGLFLARPRFAGLLTASLVALGALGFVTVAFAALGHPVDLATLFRSYQQLDTVKVTLPAGAGLWLAMAGSALILGGGLLALVWREPSLAEYGSGPPDSNDPRMTEMGDGNEPNLGR